MEYIQDVLEMFIVSHCNLENVLQVWSNPFKCFFPPCFADDMLENFCLCTFLIAACQCCNYHQLFYKTKLCLFWGVHPVIFRGYSWLCIYIWAGLMGPVRSHARKVLFPLYSLLGVSLWSTSCVGFTYITNSAFSKSESLLFEFHSWWKFLL